MDLPKEEGPDGSSIRPVSSLLAKFENMTKAGSDAPTATAPPAPRAVSPSPKTEKLREAGATASAPPASREPPPVPRTRPKDKLNMASLQVPGPVSNGITSPSRPILAPPTTSPRPVHPPSVLVEPPLSPPRKGAEFSLGDRPGLLNTDSIPKPASPSGPKQFKIPSRPHTPILDPRRSPRLSPSNPPSPPPPRRSAELRRDRETREAKAAPPPINRAEKPLIPSRYSFHADGAQAQDLKSRFADRISPFESTFETSGSPEEEDELPPMLPARPRLQRDAVPGRQQTIQTGFEPPPLHHSIASKRKECEDINGFAQVPSAPRVPEETRPVLPSRPQGAAILPGNNATAMLPPPRPPRTVPGTAAAPSQVIEAVSVQQKRVVSSPTTQQLSPPPTRNAHGRSMTVDRTSSKVPSEFRLPAQHIGETRNMTDPLGSAIPSFRNERGEGMAQTTAYPDTSRSNRSTPYIGKGVAEIPTKYDSRMFDVCGDKVCTTGSYTRVWSLLDGELLMSLAMGDGIKGVSVAFKPGANVDEEGRRVWIGNNFGEVMEADIATQSIIANKLQAHSGRQEVIKIYRHFTELWTLDESGTLHVWAPDDDGTPTLTGSPSQSYRLPRGHLFSMVVGDELWHATGKEIRVFLPTTDGRAQFQVLMRPLIQESAGEVTSGTMLSSSPGKVFFGHNDGKVSIYSRSDYSCLGVVNVSSFKINSLAGLGECLWAGYNNGRISVFDMAQTPWVVKKDWQAHENPVVKIIADSSSFYKLDRYQALSLGADNMIRVWDGSLQEDWLEEEMKRRDTEYCDFEKLRGLVMTWNAGASTPHRLRYSDSDATFIKDLLQNSDSPDILVFGFQELVDLEDKTATAKRFLKGKKKKQEGSDQERMSHQYRDWRDFLVRCLDDYMSGDLYYLLHTAPLVGLFTCVFAKADLRDRITKLSSAEVKCGMGGLYGNKGAISVRFMVDDSSFCFINCHLAAGQGNANNRHNDVATILEASVFPSERDSSVRMDTFVGGGDGTMMLDHEMCVLNGDLNYRIDTMSRDTVVASVKQGNLAKLLDRDQLLVARRRKPGFHLRAFEELPITFAPTYKYDVGTDNYDSSEKKRSPAWCDRILFRGGPANRVEQLDYRRHEVRVSDHRPVSGRFRFTVKAINPKKRAVVWMECQQMWEDVKGKEAEREKLYYLTHIIGYDTTTSQRLIRDRSSRRDHRSPSRHRD